MKVLISIRLFPCCAAVEFNPAAAPGTSRGCAALSVTTAPFSGSDNNSPRGPSLPLSLSLIIPQTSAAPVSHARRLAARINVSRLSPALRVASTLLEHS